MELLKSLGADSDHLWHDRNCPSVQRISAYYRATGDASEILNWPVAHVNQIHRGCISKEAFQRLLVALDDRRRPRLIPA